MRSPYVHNFQSKREGMYWKKSGKVSGMYDGKFIKVYDPLRVVRKLEESQETTDTYGWDSIMVALTQTPPTTHLFQGVHSLFLILIILSRPSNIA